MVNKRNLLTKILKISLISLVTGGIAFTNCSSKRYSSVISSTPIIIHDSDKDGKPDYATSPSVYLKDGEFIYEPLKQRALTKEETEWFYQFRR